MLCTYTAEQLLTIKSAISHSTMLCTCRHAVVQQNNPRAAVALTNFGKKRSDGPENDEATNAQGLADTHRA
jgi:hypothetical protein